MDKLDILNEVNNLVTVGLRKSAIEIIQEYLKKTPNDSHMLRALGKIYLLEKQPDKAVKYLQLALNNPQSEFIQRDVTSSYEFDYLDDDDLINIDKKAESTENFYIYASEKIPENLVAITKEIPFTDVPLLQLSRQQKKSYKNKSVIKKLASNGSKINHDQLDLFNSDFSQNENYIFNSTDLNHSFDDLTLPLFTSTTFFENSQYDLHNDEEISINEIYSDEDVFIISEIEDQEISEDEIYESEGASIILEFEDDDFEKEFGWNDLDDFFDEIDEAADLFIDHTIIEGKLTRSERAKQIAAKVIQEHDLDIKYLSLLQQVFFENGWGAARIAIEHELTKGLTPEEIKLALFIRELWAENQQYWVSFIHITTNQAGQQTRAAYKNMSWPEALRIIRSFGNEPSEEEIQFFIDTIYDDWYCSEKLQRQYKAFIQYLKYRTGSVRRTLPGNEIFSFIDAYDKESLLDFGYDFIKHASGIEKLKQEQINIEQMLIGIEQKYTVIKPEGDFGDPAVYGDR